MLTDLSISRGLMSGLGGGIVLTILLLICIQVTAHFTDKIPKGEKISISMSERIKSLKLLIPIVTLFCIIIIGAYAGFFSATVGGAIGAFCVTVYAVLIKRMPIKEVFNCAVESIILNSNMFALLLAGTMFGRMITLSRLPDSLINAITNSNAPVFIVFTMIVVFYFVAGAVMDIMSCMLITVPIIFPLLTALGFDSYAILIFLVIMINLGSISPPIGMGVFVSAQAVGVDPKIIFKGIWPYCLVNIGCAYIIAFVPQIVNFLPNILG